ncbi:MAG: Holliday junction branch migration protein RuvA [Chloracidobacterium sp.]|nr:Holliday junction branch migration protein RuvA [Chloracidobacterium sp.]MCC6826295.1 Holliday junction branch migration protein RuvA [Acidobacteriota bacterium]MCO5333042.1 Holliday junction branch migration protein RuvA [Pyrinomonadaceae bacterium]
MIAHLSGKIIEKTTDAIVVDVAGVGYEVSVPLSTFYELGEAGSRVSLRIHTHVREDAIVLFGFSTASERDLFLRLISVQGVGPKLAITILSGVSAEDLAHAIRTDNFARLTSIPGVGKKTAERLVLELRDKLAEIGRDARPAAGISDTEGGKAFDDALSALVNLGYQRTAAEKALQQAVKGGTEISVQKLLRAALQLLAK